MQEIKLDDRQIDRMAQKLAQAPELLREVRRRAMEAASRQAKEIVDRYIGGTGKVQRWQEAVVGSPGRLRQGHAKEGHGSHREAGQPIRRGAVTNAIVSGHAFPGRGGREEAENLSERVGRKEQGAGQVPLRGFRGEIRRLAQDRREHGSDVS